MTTRRGVPSGATDDSTLARASSHAATAISRSPLGPLTLSARPFLSIQWNTYLIEGDMTIAMALQDHGYLTGAVGKWHLGAPRLIYQYDPSPHYQDYELLERQNNLTREHCREFGFGVCDRVYRSNVGAVEVNNDIPFELKYHNLEWVTGGALAFLGQAERVKLPWFLYYAFTAPHGPPTRLSLNNPAYVTPLGIKYEGMAQQEWPQEHLQPRGTVYERALAAGVTDPDFQASTSSPVTRPSDRPIVRESHTRLPSTSHCLAAGHHLDGRCSRDARGQGRRARYA